MCRNEEWQVCDVCGTRFIDAESDGLCPRCQDELFKQLAEDTNDDFNEFMKGKEHD